MVDDPPGGADARPPDPPAPTGQATAAEPGPEVPASPAVAPASPPPPVVAPTDLSRPSTALGRLPGNGPVGGSTGGPGAMRVTDAERQAVVDQLSRATGEGLLTLTEFADAAGEAYAAMTRSGLEAVVDGLHIPDPDPTLQPAPAGERMPAPIAGPGAEHQPAAQPTGRRRWMVAVMGAEERRGRWRAERRMGAFALMGGVHLDLRGAVLDDDTVEITAWAIMGGVDVIVPEGIPVESSGFVLMGGRTDRVKDGPTFAGAPTIRVRGFGLWGGVTVRSRPPRRPESSEVGEVAPTVEETRPAVTGTAPGQLPASVADAPGATPAPGSLFGATDRAQVRRTGDLVTVVSTDIVGSTRYADALGDQRWRQVLLDHNEIVRVHLRDHDGTEVKTSGDGFLLTFTGARAALHFGVDLQEAMGAYRAAHPDTPIEVRIGVHTGEVERDAGDVIGRNVTLACRLCDVATPGEVLVSSIVADLADSASDLGFDAGRTHHLAGIDRPVTARVAHRR